MMAVAGAERRLAGAPIEGANSVRRSAYEQFQRSLLSGRIRPGQLVSQRELVSMLEISLGALRELLPRLEAEGLLTVLPQRGIQITLVDLRMIRNAYQLRMALEREAVIAALAQVDHGALAEQIALHQHILEQARADPSDPVMQRAQDVDAGMHAFLVEQTRNDLLIQAYAINSIRVRLINLERMRLTPEVLPKAFADHLDVLRAIEAGDEARAIVAIERHIRDARSRAVAL
jgi:DNA-binding GntR family transcriptional regulator